MACSLWGNCWQAKTRSVIPALAGVHGLRLWARLWWQYGKLARPRRHGQVVLAGSVLCSVSMSGLNMGSAMLSCLNE